MTNGSSIASRRRVLAGLGLGTLAAVLGYRMTAHDSRPTEGSPDWETAADDRIAEHRTTTIEIIVVDGADDPVPDAEIELSMRRHAFDFGTAVDASHLVAQSEPEDEYRAALGDLFNTAVLQNHHKWRFWEDRAARLRAETATDWLLDQGLELRGHTCIWQKRGEGAIPRDVTDAMDRGDGDYVDRRARDHVWTIVDHYADRPGIAEWDVLNEHVAEHDMTDVIEPDRSPLRSETISDWFGKAREADPAARLVLNEYNILAGDDDGHRGDFDRLVTHLLANDASLSGLGFQSHHSSPDQRRTPAQLLSTLDRFAALVPSITITEYDTWGADWTEELEAEYLYAFLKTVFSHPAVDGFLVWGFWDSAQWHDNAPFFRADWSRKPALDAYLDLVFDQWWTDETGTTTADGRYRTDAFLGDYELVVRARGHASRRPLHLADPAADRRVRVSLA